MSTEYGATPRNVLEQFREKLLEIYQIQFPQLRISDVELTSYEIAVNLPKWEEILRLMNNV